MKKIIVIFMLFSLWGKAQNEFNFVAVHLTSAQIKTMDTAPVDVGLSAPGPNKAYEVISLAVDYHYGTIPFDGADYIAIATFPLNMAQARTNIILDQSNSVYAKGSILFLTADQLVNNQKLFIHTGNDSNNGDGDCDVYITYRVITSYTNFAPSVLDTTITLTSPQLLNIFTAPVTIIPSPGANKTIEVVSATAKLLFNTTPYASTNNIALICATATAPQITFSILNGTSNKKFIAYPTTASGANATQLISNQPLQATNQITNPTAGDSSVELHIYYRIVPY